MAYVAVLSASGKSLMPTTAYKARKLLKSGRAKIYSYRPLFTIQMQDREEGTTQPIEMKVDTGAQYIGVSVCSEKHEYWNRRYDMLPNEKEMHDEARKTAVTEGKNFVIAPHALITALMAIIARKISGLLLL